jgi:hypothetical protein
MYAEDIQQLVLGLLAQTEFGNAASQAFAAVETIQENLDRLLQQQQDQRGLQNIKIGTTLLLAILGKAQMGKLPQSFQKDDWADIADSVAAYALRMDGKDYSAFVFTLYANYIDACIAALTGQISPATSEAIHALSEELRSKTDDLSEGLIDEPDYIERCLWTSLEAIVKLLSALLASTYGSAECERITTAVAQLAFEYARLRLYTEEQALLEELLAHQAELDEELKAKTDAFRANLATQSKQFLSLVDNAFSSDIRERLMGSVALAHSAGVEDEKVLHSVEKIDEFFLM